MQKKRMESLNFTNAQRDVLKTTHGQERAKWVE
jgi:hypothetical protein